MEPVAAVTAEASETEAPKLGPDLREQLIASAKERAKAKEAAKTAPEKPSKPVAEPKDKPVAEAKPKAEKPKVEPEKPKEEAPESEAELRQKRKSLAKWDRKLKAKDEAFVSRENQLQVHEQRAQHETAAFQKDPIAWLRSRNVDVRKVLLTHAQEDAEEPTAKELRELKAKTEALAKKDEEREAVAKVENANRNIEAGIVSAWKEADGGEFPLLSTMSTPEKVAAVGRKLLVDHWRATGTELDTSVLFATMERELEAYQAKQRKTTGAKPESPGRVRADKTANSESARQSTTARDVTNRTASVRTSADDAPAGKSGIDRGSLRDRLVGMVREHVRQ